MNSISLCDYNNLFIHSPTDRLGLQLSTIMNSAAINIHVYL